MKLKPKQHKYKARRCFPYRNVLGVIYRADLYYAAAQTYNLKSALLTSAWPEGTSSAVQLYNKWTLSTVHFNLTSLYIDFLHAVLPLEKTQFQGQTTSCGRHNNLREKYCASPGWVQWSWTLQLSTEHRNLKFWPCRSHSDWVSRVLYTVLSIIPSLTKQVCLFL